MLWIDDAAFHPAIVIIIMYIPTGWKNMTSLHFRFFEDFGEMALVISQARFDPVLFKVILFNDLVSDISNHFILFHHFYLEITSFFLGLTFVLCNVYP